ncbi:hypothetical protein L1D41_16240, partial [Vibrio harveyi]|uniref:hypothetical protein n=1 Tax=Vibrio harveyi TaxID=669 RepID=UPI001EFD0F88
EYRPVTPGVAGSSPVRSATYSDKALAEMLGLFRLRYYFGLRPTSPARVRVQLRASPAALSLV